MTAPQAARPAMSRPVVAVVVQQHAEESALLSHVRSVLVRAPHVGLLQLGRIDERIAAHLDGLAVAGSAGKALANAALERPGAGEVFAATVLALETRDGAWFDEMLALAAALPEAWRGVARALGWVSATELQGVVRSLLTAPDAPRRCLGLAACRMHQVDPGPAIDGALSHDAPAVRAAALRAGAELGRLDILERAVGLIGDDHPDVVFWAAWAACLLGDRNGSLRVLGVAAQQETPLAGRALSLAMAAASPEQADDLARAFSHAAQAEPANRLRRRRLLRALGQLGDVRFVPWLIERMAEPELARLAGESFSWITGADLARQDLETLVAPALPEQPSDDPADEDVALDEDDSLPWPDVAKVQAWWEQQTALRAPGRPRLFDGEAPSPACAARVLRERTQRKRAYAALLACACEPGRRLFQIAAPTPRQRRWVAT